ncbi:hypothetical protein Acr_05g0005710 [Actinidia rufa]|uniref:Uncharacterized protein n=1 Tax=Actinidia rufa TaxID=165716 RepID=A0A7J0EKV6_9ERIC|nr:hypothetical protein Acr_05g0005710 [Actinidia rufa]
MTTFVQTSEEDPALSVVRFTSEASWSELVPSKYLGTFSEEDASNIVEAKEEAFHAIIEFVKVPDMFQEEVDGVADRVVSRVLDFQIEVATNNFLDNLDDGDHGFSNMYKGWIYHQTLDVTIRCMEKLISDATCSHIRAQPQLHHPHILSSIGYCDDAGCRMLVHHKTCLQDWGGDKGQRFLACWFRTSVQRKTINQIIDRYLVGSIPPKCLRGFVKITWSCLLDWGTEQPAMNDVVGSLQVALPLQQTWHNNDDPVDIGSPSSVTRAYNTAG